MNNKYLTIEIEFSESSPHTVKMKSNGLQVMELPEFTYITNETLVHPTAPNDRENVHDFSKKNKGVVIQRNKSCVKITNDPFCTIPLYYFKNSKKVIITSEPYDFYSSNEPDIDQAGLWEVILFGSCLWNRTLFKELNQFPSASELIITKETLSLERYWNFNIEEDHYLNSEKNLVDALDSKLTEVFTKLPEKRYLMGISGGLDSRLSAAYLHKTGKAHLVNSFTYCSTKESLDYKLAQTVCQKFGLQEPKLCILDELSYRNTLDFLPKYSCGQIGIQHSHICSVLERYYSQEPYTQISNYFSDALFGFECSGVKNIQNGQDSLTRILNTVDGLSVLIKEDIEGDIDKIFTNFDPNSNYSSLDEYKYVTERNQKFHMNLAFQQSRFMDTCLPYADHDILELMMSVPLHLRKRKKVLDLLFDSGVVANFKIEDISSRHFIAGNQFANQGINSFIKKIDFKFQNALSALIAKITRGKIIYPNKYHTESHVNMLHVFSEQLNDSCNKLYKAGVFTEEQRNDFSSIPIRSHGVSERFQLLSLTELL